MNSVPLIVHVYKYYLKKHFQSPKTFTTFVTLMITSMNSRLKQFLAAENITQAQFADTLQIVRASVSHVLSGRNNPSYDFIRAIMEHYPLLNIEWLMLGTGKMYKNAPSDSPIISSAPVTASAIPDNEPGSLFAEEPSVESADKTDDAKDFNAIRTLIENVQTPVKQRKAVKVMILFDDGSYQEL